MAAYADMKAMTVREVKKLRRNKPDSDTLLVCEKIISKADYFYEKAKASGCRTTLNHVRNREIRNLTMVCTIVSYALAF